jgi:4-aminobutyrate aminotransferase-like enzyme
MSASVLLRTGIVPDAGPRPVTGEGVYVSLSDGRKVVDASASPLALGHRHPRILRAASNALSTSPTLDEGFSTSLRESTAAELVETVFAGEDWVGAVRFALTGSEANDLALSLAQAITGRTAFVTRERAYHGMVGLARDITVQPQWHGGLTFASGGVRAVPPSAPVQALPFPQGRFGDGLALSRDQAEVALADAQPALRSAAAVIVDYTQGGCYPAPSYQDVLATKARAAGALWIADEVVTGFGKCGRWLNFQRGEERPDIVTLGKSMGGGVAPAAAVVLSKNVLARMGDGSWINYSSMRSSDLAAATAREFVRVIDEQDLVARADALHGRILTGMRALASGHPGVSRIDGCGLHWWIEVGETDWRNWRGDGPETPVATHVASAVLDAGAMVATTGEANVILVTLPMIIEDRELDLVMGALDDGLTLADRIVGEQAVRSPERVP